MLSRTTFMRRCFALRWSKFQIPGEQRENKDYKRKMAETRKRMRVEYDKLQTEAEIRWLEEYTKQQEVKWTRDMDKARTAICRISAQAQKQLDFVRERDLRMAERGKIQTVREAQKSFERRLMLDAMEIERTNWPTKDNYQRVISDVSFPPALVDNEQYLERLRTVL